MLNLAAPSSKKRNLNVLSARNLSPIKREASPPVVKDLLDTSKAAKGILRRYGPHVKYVVFRPLTVRNNLAPAQDVRRSSQSRTNNENSQQMEASVALAPAQEPSAKVKPEKEIEVADALNQSRAGSPKLVMKNLLPKPLSSVMSPLTASVNEETLKSLLNLELRNKRLEQAEANFGTIDEPSPAREDDDSPRSPTARKPAPPDIC